MYGALEEAIDHMKKAYEIMNQQAVDLHKEKETFESVAKNMTSFEARKIFMQISWLHIQCAAS